MEFTKLPCPECKRDMEFVFDHFIENVEVKGVSVTYLHKAYVCISCGTEVETAKTLDRNLKRAQLEYEYTREDLE